MTTQNKPGFFFIGVIFVSVFLWSIYNVSAESFQNLTEIIRSLAPIQETSELKEQRQKKTNSIDLEISFQLNSAVLTLLARKQLIVLADAMKTAALRSSRFRISGHTDSVGNAPYNKALSQRRAAAVGEYLSKKCGINAFRFDIFGFGEEKPKLLFDTSNAKNRRVEILALGPFKKPQKKPKGNQSNTKYSPINFK